jgi:hypothetical protein
LIARSVAGRFIPPDPSKGDENTIGGYMAVHARPAAFEGSDGLSYSVAIEVDRSDDAAKPYGAYFLFVRWRRMGQQGVEGHLESPFLAFGETAAGAKEALGGMRLSDVRATLETLIRNEAGSTRRWWDAMRDDDE